MFLESIKLQHEHKVCYHWDVGFWLFVVPATIIQFLGHFNWRLISQSIKGISRALWTLLRCFNETINRHLLCYSLVFVLVFLLKFEWSTMIAIIRKINNISIIFWSWFICIVLPQTSWYLPISITVIYSIKLYIDITTSIFWASSICVLFISVMQSVKRAQF